MPKRGLVSWVVLASIAFAACDGDGPTGASEDGVGVIGPQGGVVSLGTEARVEIPPGALTREVTIRIVRVPATADLQAQGAVGQAYRFEPVDQSFLAPVRISIVVPPSALGGRPIDSVTILRSTSPSGALAPAAEELGSIVRSSDGTVSGATTRLGVFSAATVNQGPAADAGPDQTIAVGTIVNLSGSGSDPDGDALTFSWSFVSRPAGSNATIAGGSVAAASFLADVAGTYELQLTVSDGDETASDTVRITASAAGVNRAPIADAGPDLSGPLGQTVHLDGSRSSDPDGDALRFSWRFLPGSPATPPIADADRARASFVPPSSGIYVLELIVSDASLSDADSVRVAVATSNAAPRLTVNAPDAVFLGATAHIAASASDDDGDPVTITIALVSKPSGSQTTLSVTGTTASLTPDVIGGYTVAVSATDGKEIVSQTVTVWGNPSVAGVYTTTFTITSASSACGDSVSPGSATRDMAVSQPTAGSVVFQLTALSENIKTDPVLTLRGTAVHFSGPIRLEGSSGGATASGVIAGTIDGTRLDTNMRFAVFTCVVLGTIVGTRN